jgi:hypothetical protein
MNIHIQRELVKQKEAWSIFYGIMFPFVVIGVPIFLIIKFPIILAFAGVIIIPHLIGNYFIKKYKNLPPRKDAFIGGEEIK